MQVRFEKTECSRCGGTGHYSYNAMTGTVCFKCNGQKTELTKSGAAARAEWVERKQAMTTTLVDDVQVGQRIENDYGTKRTVVEVRRGRDAGSCQVIDGVPRWDLAITLVTKSGTRLSHQLGATVHRALTSEEFAQLARSLAHLPGISIFEPDKEGANG